jgi:DNA-binding MarR family transcriptional regulator
MKAIRRPRPNPVPPGDCSPLAQSIGYQARLAYRLLEKYIQKTLVAHDNQIGMWYFLRVLWLEDGLTQRELSRRVGTTEPSALEQLRRMETRGLIARSRSDGDRRKSLVVLTREGRSLEKKLLKYVDDVNAVAFEGFSDGDVKRLRELLARLCHNVRRANEA